MAILRTPTTTAAPLSRVFRLRHPKRPLGQAKRAMSSSCKFMTRPLASFLLAKDGISESNTLFVVTADENDHFTGGPPSPANCDGINTPCTYEKKGEITADLTPVFATEFGDTTAFGVHFDTAPTFYINGNPGQT